MSATNDALESLLRQVQDLAQQVATLTGQQSRPKRSIWTPSQVARELGLRDVETVRAWCKDGRIPAAKNTTDGWEIANDVVESVRSRGNKPWQKGCYDNNVVTART